MAQLVERLPRDLKVLSSNSGLEKNFYFFLHNEVKAGAHSALFWVMNVYWRSEGSEFTSWAGKKNLFLHNEVRDGGQGAQRPFLDGCAQHS